MVDLVEIPNGERINNDVEAMIENINQVHEEVKQHLLENNINHKLIVDRHRQHKEFEFRECVMVFLIRIDF